MKPTKLPRPLPRMRSEVQRKLFERYSDHMKKATLREGNFDLHMLEAANLMATIHTNGWLNDFRCWARTRL